MCACRERYKGGVGGKEGFHTELSPDHLGQRTDELRRCVAVPSQRFFVDYLTDREPKGCFQALEPERVDVC